jgi:hypothetical protein
LTSAFRTVFDQRRMHLASIRQDFDQFLAGFDQLFAHGLLSLLWIARLTSIWPFSTAFDWSSSFRQAKVIEPAAQPGGSKQKRGRCGCVCFSSQIYHWPSAGHVPVIG